jgi:hypothetical protein
MLGDDAASQPSSSHLLRSFLKLPRIRFLLADYPGAGDAITAGLLRKELKISLHRAHCYIEAGLPQAQVV